MGRKNIYLSDESETRLEQMAGERRMSASGLIAKMIELEWENARIFPDEGGEQSPGVKKQNDAQTPGIKDEVRSALIEIVDQLQDKEPSSLQLLLAALKAPAKAAKEKSEALKKSGKKKIAKALGKEK